MASVIVCGLGQVGYRVATLLRRLGEDVTVLTLECRDEYKVDVENAGAKVLMLDARTEANLEKAGIREAQAIIACTDNDLTNLEIALDVAAMNPKARIVVRLFDLELAKRLEGTAVISRALAMSHVSAPAFAAAATEGRILGLLHQSDDAEVIARVQQADWEQRGPESDCTKITESGGEVYVVGDRKQLDALAPRNRSAIKLAPSRFRSAWLRFSALNAAIPKALKILAVGIVGMALISIFVFQIELNLSPIDALYFVVTTLTTTGYGDITPVHAEPWLKLYVCLMMVLGSAALATLYSIITDLIVTARLNQYFGRQPTTFDGHVIVAGIGKVGFRISQELEELGAEVVGIDTNYESKYRNAIAKNGAFIGGDARDEETLIQSGVERASAIIAATSDDAVNLGIALTAKRLNPEIRTVTRLFDVQFAAKVQNAMDIDVAISASHVAAPVFVGAALFDNAAISFEVGDRLVTLISTEAGVPYGIEERLMISLS